MSWNGLVKAQNSYAPSSFQFFCLISCLFHNKKIFCIIKVVGMICKSNDATPPKKSILIPGCKATKQEKCQGGEYFCKPLQVCPNFSLVLYNHRPRMIPNDQSKSFTHTLLACVQSLTNTSLISCLIIYFGYSTRLYL